MKILIVNGYSNTPKGKEEFHRFQQIIQELFRTQNDFVDTNFEFIIRGKDDLDDYIYELDSPYVRKTSAKAFDYIDMVFIEGDPNLLPWSPQAAKMLILLRMCIRTKKVLFASSFGMQALVFLAATNIEKNISVINGKGKGGKITDILRFNEKITSIKHDEYYLDNSTGDLYTYNYDTSEWIPKMNVGLHYVKAAQAFDSVGKFVMNTQVYKAKIFEDNPMSYLSKSDEDFCYTKKMYMQHWAISDLPSEFVVPAKNSWDIHKFNFVNVKKTFVVLAESRRCPQIIVFEPFCVATLFPITKKYSLTVAILKNFITSKLKEIKSMTRKESMGIEAVSEIYRSKAENTQNSMSEVEGSQTGRKNKYPRAISNLRSVKHQDHLLSDSSLEGRPRTAKLFHSGYALAHHDGPNLIVENNTVRNTFTIKLGSDRSLQPREPGSIARSPKIKTISRIETNPDHIILSPKSNLISPTESSNQAIALHNYLQKAHDKKSNKTNRKNSFSQYTEENTLVPGYLDKNTQNQTDSTNETKFFKKNKAEIARMLYPDIPRNAVKEEELWVPGQLSQLRPETEKTKTKIKVTMETSFSSRFYSTFNKFKNTNPDDARTKPSIRTSGDYLTEDERKRLEEKENSKKNLGSSKILTGSISAKSNMIPNYVTLTYSEPPANYKFREIKKDKWVAGPMKLC